MAKKSLTKNESSAILSPRITEKGARGHEAGVYVFNVATSTNKAMIKSAVESLYGVSVLRVNVTSIRPKKVSSRKGRPGITSQSKKAVVYLKKGENITLS